MQPAERGHRKAIDRSRGGLTTKLHTRTYAQDLAIGFCLPPGQVSEMAAYENWMQEEGPIQPRYWPTRATHRAILQPSHAFPPHRNPIRQAGIKLSRFRSTRNYQVCPDGLASVTRSAFLYRFGACYFANDRNNDETPSLPDHSTRR